MTNNVEQKPEFDIFPAIDLLDGQSVRLIQGRRESAHVVHPDPLVQIRDYAAAGAVWVHIVNLNAAFGDNPETHPGARKTESLIAELVKSSGLRVQLGGGIRSMAAVEHGLLLGVERLVIGTWVVSEFDLVMERVRKEPERFVLGVDSFGGKIAIRGWTQSSDETTIAFARRLCDAGARRVLFTEVERDGLLQGAAIEASAELAAASGLQVIASGGVRGLDDIRALSQHTGVCGVVTGKALASGTLSLSEALFFQKR